MLVWLDGGGCLVRDPPQNHAESVANNHVQVINGVISLPIAVLAYFFLPDTPGTAKPNWIFNERVSTTLGRGS